MQNVKFIMVYANTYSNACVRFYASDMQLMVDYDAAYLVFPKSCCRIAGYFRLTNTSIIKYIYKDNGEILIKCHTLRDGITSATEAETKGIFQHA